MFNNKYKRFFKPTDFSLIIADESHRSINGNSRAVFEYFLGYKLGLTATPKDYIKNIDVERLKATDPRAWEKRQLLDSYKTFGCESGDPTYRYSLLDASALSSPKKLTSSASFSPSIRISLALENPSSARQHAL